MRTLSVNSLADVAPGEWNAVAGTRNPFLTHEFLSALERSGCVGRGTGWLPRHVLAYEGETLVGAVPLYLKDHSYGEYVFDWAWASAASRARIRYYPKLVAAVPFTPATGRRLLVHRQASVDVYDRLLDEVEACADATAASSVHWLFPDAADAQRLQARGLLLRTGYQFHWHNRDYRDFDHFLADFSSHKRKNIKRERRQVREQGIDMVVVSGATATPAQWEAIHLFYRTTIAKYGAIAYLTPAFFHDLATHFAERALLVFAYRDGQPIAGALNFVGGDTLYGRHWGALEDVPGLHFETCYYQPIEACIALGLARFEAGAQGEHKLSRGFLPTVTRSAHWLRHPGLRAAVDDYLAREREGIAQEIDELNEHAPFRRDPP